jgi:hypothetical protein
MASRCRFHFGDSDAGRVQVTRRTSVGLATVAVLLAIAIVPASAWAIDVPGIDGHLTDPRHILSASDKTAIDEKLGKIQQDTRIDVAGWIVDAPPEALAELGNEAYRRWNIGRDWDNGVFLIVPKAGRAQLIQKPERPALSKVETEPILAADNPTLSMNQRLDRLADAAGTAIRGKTFHARPPGKNDPPRGIAYAGGAAVVLLIALGLTWRARKREPV